MEHARERWAALTNATLERAGRHDRVDHRSYARQGIDREPGQHFGPAAAHMVGREEAHDRLDSVASTATAQDRLQAVDQAITVLAAERDRCMREDEARPDNRRATTYDVGSGDVASRDDDGYPGR